jgi:cation:H+ antiporter
MHGTTLATATGFPVAATVLFPIGTVVSLASSFVLVTRLERLAGGVSEAMLGLLVALAADSPEITSAIAASARGKQSIGIGVVLGSGVFNLAALLGLGAIVAARIDLHRRVVLLEGTCATWVALVTLGTVAGAWAAGVGLVLVLVVVVPYVVVAAVPSSALARLGVPARATGWLSRAVAEEELELSEAIHPSPSGRADAALALASLAAVVAGSTVMERSAETFGTHFGLSPLVVGGIVLAAVTSLPNAVGAVYLAARRRGSAVLSEAMNSNMLNVVIGLFLPGVVLGLGSATADDVLVAIWFAGLTVGCLVAAFVRSGLSRSVGLLIVAAYVVFVVVVASR